MRMRVVNGVAGPGREPENERDHYPDHEYASVGSPRRYTRPGDSVVGVGGGWGRPPSSLPG